MSNIKIVGSFEITPKLTDYDKFYLLNFNATQHIKRDESKLIGIYGGSNGYNGHYGNEGQFFINYIIGPDGNLITKRDRGWVTKDFQEFDSIVDDKNPPTGQPGLFCPWRPNVEGDKLLPDNRDYYQSNYAWLKWLITNFFDGMYKLNGEVVITAYETKMQRIIQLNDSNVNYKSKKIEEEKPLGIKHNNKIIDDIILKTKSGEIKWEEMENKKSELPLFHRYVSNINLHKGVSLLLNLFIVENTNSNKNYINIHLKKSNNLKFFRCIKNYKVNDLIEFLKKEKVID